MVEKQPTGRQARELEEFFQRHADGLAGGVRAILGSRAEVQDVLQDAYLKAYEALRRGSRPENPSAWLFVLVLNQARDARRKQGRRPERELDDVEAMRLQAREPGPDGALSAAETVDAARAAIGTLGDEERQVFLMRASGELTFEAIARALDIPVGTAKTRMRRALGVLRQRLAGLRAGDDDGGQR